MSSTPGSSSSNSGDWTGHILVAPRIRIQESLVRPEAMKTGVYLRSQSTLRMIGLHRHDKSGFGIDRERRTHRFTDSYFVVEDGLLRIPIRR
jgi:hypothetical protein